MSDQPHQPQGPHDGGPDDGSRPPLAPPGARPPGVEGATPYAAPAPPYTSPAAPYGRADERPAYQPPASPYGTPSAGSSAPASPYAAPAPGSSPYAGAPGASDGPTTSLPPAGQAPYGQAPYGQAPYGQTPYGQTPYGQAPYGPGYGQGGYGPPNPAAYGAYAPPPRLRTNGVAIAALVVGGLGLLVFLVPFLGAVLGLAGVVLGILGIRRARGDMGGKGLAIGGLAAGGLALLLGALVTAGFLLALRTTQTTIDEALEDAERQAQEVEDERSDGSTEIGASDEAELAAATPLPLGQSATVGDYTVTVTAVDTDADDVVAAADPYNAEPTHRYVLVDLTVVYAGDGEGDPFWELDSAVLGSDGREYPATACWATLPQDPWELDPVAPGATASYQLCMDVPAEAAAGSTLRVQELFSLTGETPAFWAVP